MWPWSTLGAFGLVISISLQLGLMFATLSYVDGWTAQVNTAVDERDRQHSEETPTTRGQGPDFCRISQ